jgi:uncharacterized Ntn-hydrolase superfamily protein
VTTRRAGTYSIVARDPATGELGVAVQSHYFSVGPLVPWAEAGVGAVATQSLVRVDYGPHGLALMGAGRSAAEALADLVAADDNPAVRQVAMVDAAGRAAAHTGERCIPAAGHQVGRGYSVQANLMERDSVWPAMAAAFEAAEDDLAERMLAALEAAEGEGGDIRGRQSAALLVVAAEPSGEPWVDRRVDLRVEDHPEPLGELRRLLRLRRAYDHADAGDEHLAAGDFEAAMTAYRLAVGLAPEVTELRFWAAVAMFTAGHEGEALEWFREVFAAEDRWLRLLPRLATVGLFPDDAAAVALVLAVTPGDDLS